MKLDAGKLKEFGEKLKTGIGKVSKKVWITLAVILVLVAAGITIYLNTRPYSILVTGATPEEVTTVVTWLGNRGVTNYRYQGTDTILVPERQAPALKASLLTELYSTGKSSFSGYFDNVNMLSTEKERSNAFYIALKQEFESVISSLDGVQSAQVTLTPGEDRSYVLDSNNVVEATASVVVTMRAGRSMTSQLAAAIRGYLSGGVQGLSMDSVKVYDNYGNPFNAGTISGNGTEATSAKLKAEEEYRNNIRTEIMWVLAPYFGEDGVRVGVNVDIEWGDKTVETHEPWIPDYVDTRDEGKGIRGSEVYSYQYYANGEVVAGGLVGSGVNSDIMTDVERLPTTDDTSGKLGGSGQIDYNNPYTDTHYVFTAGRVTDCSVSVSLDSSRVGEVDTEALRALVAKAAGITAVETETMTAQQYLASKITIYAAPFYRPGSDPILPGGDNSIFGIPLYVILIAAAALLLLVIILVIVLLVLRAKRKKRKKAEELAQQLEQQQSMEELLAAMGTPQLEAVGADVMSLQTEKSMELRQDIRQFAEENPEVAAQLLRTWLRGGEENG